MKKGQKVPLKVWWIDLGTFFVEAKTRKGALAEANRVMNEEGWLPDISNVEETGEIIENE